jgi:hypothetical protein
MNLLSPRTVQRAERVVDMPSRPEQVPPGLRFMLRPEALEEAWAFWKWLDSVVFDMMTDQHRKAFFESQVVATLPSKYPLLAMADRAVGGEFTKALLGVGRTPEMPGWWHTMLLSLRQGHPEHFRARCGDVIAASNPESEGALTS